MNETGPLLSLNGIEFSYEQIPALRGVDFDLHSGEIHALVGDHRSGKTTLASIIAGYRRIQKGEYLFRGQPVRTLSVKSALAMGISFVQQDKELIPSMNVVDNIFIGTGPRFILSRKEKLSRQKRAEDLIEMIYPGIPIDTPLYKLSEHQKLFVNIARALAREPEILIVDEISQSMTPEEVEQIYGLLFSLKKKGKSIIYITSNFNEIFKVADRVTIMKDGFRQGTESVGAVDPSRLVNMAFNFSISADSLDAGNEAAPLAPTQEHLINDLPIGDLLINEKKQLVIINRIAADLLDTEAEKGADFEELLQVFKDGNRRQIIELIEQQKSETLKGLIVGDRFINLTLAPLFNRNRRFIGTNIMLEDVSFDYHTREYLMQVKKVATTAELAAGVAHEIKNPLTIIQNYLELLKLSLKLPFYELDIFFICIFLKRQFQEFKVILDNRQRILYLVCYSGGKFSCCCNLLHLHEVLAGMVVERHIFKHDVRTDKASVAVEKRSQSKVYESISDYKPLKSFTLLLFDKFDNLASVAVLENLKQLFRIAADLLDTEAEKGADFEELLQVFKDGNRRQIIELIEQQKSETLKGLIVGDRFINLTLAPLFNRNRRFIGTNIMLEDVSFDYHTREYLMQVKKVATTAELAAGVAHEIKNPLTIIQNYLELLKLSLKEDADKEYVKFIEGELKRIVDIIGNLLSFSRVKQSDVARLDVIELMDEISMLLGHQLKKNRINLEKNFPKKAVYLTGEENKLKQLFLNLISNSIDAVLENGVIRIEIDEDSKDRNIRISVIDDGHGIPMDIQDDIFNPFYTTKVTRTNTGLGLSICRNIAESHGGVITFQSTPGRGTRFTVTLPADK